MAEAGVPAQLWRLGKDDLIPVRDGVQNLVDIGFDQIADVPGLHKLICDKLRPPNTSTVQPEEPGEELPPLPENIAEIITGSNPEMPFVRFDDTAIPKTLEVGVEVFIKSSLTETVVGPNDGAEAVADGEELAHVLVLERRDGDDCGNFNDGDQVLVKHADSGNYLTCRTDHKALTFEGRDEDSQAQVFTVYKKSRPKVLKHGDDFFLRSWLGNYIGQEPNCKMVARRWLRGEDQELRVLKKAYVEAQTTELARKMQFQAFDNDGNGDISKTDMAYMLHELSVDKDPEELVASLDPDGNGKIDFLDFKKWADEDGLEQSVLHHAEVLGNLAQRCSDAIYVEKALVEVLALVPGSMMREIIITYAAAFGGAELYADVEEKGKDGDGWIFSSYWKTALCALVESEEQLWCRALNDAMRGLGTDEGTLTALVCTLPERLRPGVCELYKERYEKSLVDHIRSETSFSYKKVLVLQAMPPEECKARMLNQAMDGLGTDEGQLVRVLCLCDFGQRRAVTEAYARMYNKGLIQHIESETSGDLKTALVCMLSAEEAEFDIEADCESMKVAMDGWGTDEKALIDIICARTPQQMEDINAKFQELYDKSLFDRVKSETSGHFQATLLGCIRHPMKQLAHSVRDCIKGWGTDDSGLICCLVHLEEFKREALIKAYMDEFGRDLLKDVKNDTSGSYQKALLSLIKPAPVVWADALTGAMKGLGTSDELLINFMAIAKDNMAEVRGAFATRNGKSLAEWIEGDCSGDYRDTLVAVAKRNSEDLVDMAPIYWAQRLRDSLQNASTMKDVLVSFPGVAIQRGTQVFQEVYGASLREEIAKVCDEQKSWFSFSNYWKATMLSLMDMPIERYVKSLNDAMAGLGTDEYSLTGLICTMPSNLYKDIHSLYEKNYGKTLVDHVESETSFDYKRALVYQCLSKPQSRARALMEAMEGFGTSEDQLIRVVICCTTHGERRRIREAFMDMYHKDLVETIESETSGSFKSILKAVMECDQPEASPNYTGDCEAMKKAMDGLGTDEEEIIRIVARKGPKQIAWLRERWDKMYGEPSLLDRIDSETSDWGTSIFTGDSFRQAILAFLRPPAERLACAVRDCIKGWGTDDKGLITCLVHLPEKDRVALIEAYKHIKDGGDLFEHIKGDTSGCYEHALLALLRPAPQVIAEGLVAAMKGLGTSDELLINWMCIGKDRMDEVREEFKAQQDADLADWLEGDCSGDYKDTLVRLAKRQCFRFPGNDTGLTIPAPPSKKMAIERFNKTFNALCRQKKANPDEMLECSEAAQQEMACAFTFYCAPERSSCSPNMDRVGLWNCTNDCGFPPANDTDDLDATFNEWDWSGTGEITWNDFVREMTVRVNDPNHYEADPLPEVVDLVDDEWRIPPETERPEQIDEEYEAPTQAGLPEEVMVNDVPIPRETVLQFLEALRGEYVRGEECKVGAFFDSGISDDFIGAFDPCEAEVREADDKEAAVGALFDRWSC